MEVSQSIAGVAGMVSSAIVGRELIVTGTWASE